MQSGKTGKSRISLVATRTLAAVVRRLRRCEKSTTSPSLRVTLVT